jgi:hypothetical protein
MTMMKTQPRDTEHPTESGETDTERRIRDARNSVWRQVRFPRSKKRRVRKKWAKNQRNYCTIIEHQAYIMGDTCIVTTAIYQELRKKTDFSLAMSREGLV